MVVWLRGQGVKPPLGLAIPETTPQRLSEATRGVRQVRSDVSLVEDKMKRIVLQILLGIAGLLMVFRFGVPALIFGATGPGPLGNRWLEEGTPATLLLDADLRFFGAMMIGLGIIFFWTISRVEEPGPLIYVLATSVEFGAAARIFALVKYGNPGTAGIIPIVIEGLSPILIVLLRSWVGKEVKAVD